MGDEQVTVSKLREITVRTGVGYIEVAVAAGVSPTTTRHVLATGRLPERDHPRERIALFVARNADARSRSDLRFV